MKLSDFASSTNFPGLTKAVVRQMGGWESFQESAPDVARHGADGGFGGFIYYSETEPFAKRNKEAILSMAREMASELGSDGAYSLIAGFRCLQPTNADTVADAISGARHEDHTQVMNALAWFALEEVSRAFVDQK